MKKTICLLLTVSLAFGVLVGCGKKPKEEVVKNTPKTEAPAALSAEKPTLRMLIGSRNFDPNTYPVAKLLEEKTGYKVQYEMLPAEGANDKLNLLMANKEQFDIIKISRDQYMKLAIEGALEPLDELLDKYGKTLKSVNDAEALESAKVNGKLYAIPEQAPRPYVGSAIAVRQDIMDELKLSTPTTLDEFYNVLKTIKEKKNMIPLVGYEGVFAEIASAFGLAYQWDEKDGKIINWFENPAMKEYLAFMNKLYKEGLIDSEWPVNNVANVQQKFTSGKAAMIRYGWSWAPSVNPALLKNFPNAKVSLIPALKGKDGKSVAILNATGITSYIAIPKVSKNKEHTMNYMNMKVQPELFKSLAIGEENVHYKKEADGKLYPILPIFNDERGNADMYLTSTDIKAYRDFWLLRVRKDKLQGEYFDEMQKQTPIGKVTPLNFAPPLEAAGSYSQKIVKMENDFIIKVIAGAEKLENMDKFIEQWKTEGGTAILKEYNDWYSKSKKK
jgi:putative aldouronate transport system substrate-binding protein